MTARIICSRRVERVWQTKPAWQHPSRRRHVHGAIIGIPNRRRLKAHHLIAIVMLGVGLIFAGSIY